MKWACEKSEVGHALAPARDEEALWSGWACSHCGERFARPGDSDSYELPLMERVVEVNALALMLDGSTSPVTKMRLIGHVRSMASPYAGHVSLLERYLRTEADVAQAILELEGNSDAWASGGDCIENSDLALRAWSKTPKSKINADSIAERFLRAAALLRDGWRPGKRAKRRAS